MIKTGDTISKKYLVSESIYTGFMHLFDDNNLMHTNEKFAMAHGFEGKVMHGNILNGFLSNFIGECLPEKEVIIHSQEIQYKNPVYLNDELLFEAKVSGVFESVSAIEFKFTFKNSASKTVAKGKIQIGILK